MKKVLLMDQSRPIRKNSGSGLFWIIILTLILSSTLLSQRSGRLIDLLSKQRKILTQLKNHDQGKYGK
ncbi:MAG: hypothetical protein HQM09_10880 [Candidatus Riflebacteria bacterium]|nr:hypothetical protein [Candidatus Riflebacteria bacterium]